MMIRDVMELINESMLPPFAAASYLRSEWCIKKSETHP
jgi:hypothetical protein